MAAPEENHLRQLSMASIAYFLFMHYPAQLMNLEDS